MGNLDVIRPADYEETAAAYAASILKKEAADLEMIILAAGSEVQFAEAAGKELGDGVRVVSMPNMRAFDLQSAEYKESVLPADCRKRVAIEAGVSGLWYKYTGLDGKVVG